MTPAAFAAAGIMDVLAGDPRWFPHPVRGFGLAARNLERVVRRFARGNANAEIVGGGLIVATLVVGGAAVTRGARGIALRFGPRYAEFADVLIAWTTLAARDLIAEVNAVLVLLDAGDLVAARARLGRIVGRDTAALDPSAIARALIETLAESLCDGVVAPLCALALAGPPGAIAFKAASTLDSMIGHIEAPYTNLGLVAAKLDDVLCFVPARIAALAIALCAPVAGGSAGVALRTLWIDGGKHPSPNAGRVEAAMAGALAVRLGGTLSYGGVPVARAMLGADHAAPTVGDVRRARTVVIAAAFMVFALLLAQLELVSRAPKR